MCTYLHFLWCLLLTAVSSWNTSQCTMHRCAWILLPNGVNIRFEIIVGLLVISQVFNGQYDRMRDFCLFILHQIYWHSWMLTGQRWSIYNAALCFVLFTGYRLNVSGCPSYIITVPSSNWHIWFMSNYHRTGTKKGRLIFLKEKRGSSILKYFFKLFTSYWQ